MVAFVVDMACRATILWALPLAVACAEPVGRPARPPSARAPVPLGVERAEPPPDLSPVPEPKSLVLVARIQPDLLARLPLDAATRGQLSNPLSVLAPQLPASLGELVTSAPIEAAVAIDSPEALLVRGADWVWSLPLVSFDTALAFFRERERHDEVLLERRGSGVVSVVTRGVGPALTCVLSAALGPAPARLVCAEERASLDVLGAYAARGLPTRALGPEPLVVEAWPARFARDQREKLAALARFVAPAPASAGRWVDGVLSTLAADGVELLGDVQRARLALAESTGGLSGELTLDMDEQRSWFARTLGSLPPRSPGLRQLFERLPASTEAAWFFSAAQATRSDEARAAFAGWLAAGLGPSARRETVDLVAHTFVQRAPHLYAHGDAYDKDVFRERQSGRTLWETTRSTYGWHVIGFDEPARAFVPKLDQGMRAYNNGALRDLAYRTLPNLCSGLAKIRKKPAPRQLPTGSVVYELPLPGRFFDDCMKGRGSPERAPDDAIVVVLMPLGQLTFIGFGLQERDMIARMRELARPGASRVSASQLAVFEDPDVRLGGFLSLAGVGGLMRFATMREHARWTRRSLASVPHRGRTPAPFSISVGKPGTPGSTGSTRLVAKLELPTPILADIAAR